MATCFVVQGFGKKTDFTNGRVYDLDASYEVIKGAVTSAGLECLRADEIRHSGTIDLPMYQQLLYADLVIADLSTYNINAAFELGVRYGLRPHATILVAEDGFKNPFDVGHIVILNYKHLGEDIGAREARRFANVLRETIARILAAKETDSPIYTFLPRLHPPQEQVIKGSAIYRAGPGAPATSPGPIPDSSPKELLEQAQERIAADDFATACTLLETIREQRPNDSFVVQQLALATYKAKRPDPKTALHVAADILQDLSPATTNDPETLGLWGAIHKRLWEVVQRPEDLAASIEAYQRGFYIKQDYYNGINLAFLLNVRALEAAMTGDHEETLVDSALARRTRREVVRYATALLEGDRVSDNDQRYWIVATLWEAAIGLDDAQAIARWEREAEGMPVADWMRQTRKEQGERLREVLKRLSAFGFEVQGCEGYKR